MAMVMSLPPKCTRGRQLLSQASAEASLFVLVERMGTRTPSRDQALNSIHRHIMSGNNSSVCNSNSSSEGSLPTRCWPQPHGEATGPSLELIPHPLRPPPVYLARTRLPRSYHFQCQNNPSNHASPQVKHKVFPWFCVNSSLFIGSMYTAAQSTYNSRWHPLKYIYLCFSLSLTMDALNQTFSKKLTWIGPD